MNEVEQFVKEAFERRNSWSGGRNHCRVQIRNLRELRGLRELAARFRREDS